MPSAALAAIRRRVVIEWPKVAEADAKRFLIDTAKAGHQRILREQASREGVIPEFTYYANQPGNTNLESVRLPGPIVFRYTYRREIVLALIRALQNNSPVQSGLYKRSHTLFIDGVLVSLNTPIRPGQEVFIANPVVYSRRLEVGKTESGRAFVIQVAPRIYERTMKQIAPRYKNAARLTFGYVEMSNAYITKAKLGSHYAIGEGRRRRRHQKAGSAVQAPAIFIGSLS